MKLQDFRYYKRGKQIGPTRLKLQVPAFAFIAQTWTGASKNIGTMLLGNQYMFSLKLPVKPIGSDFVLAIRWKDGLYEKRFKLWEDVGETLFYPLYDGETVGVDAALEIWTINTANAPTLALPGILYSSVLVFPQGTCCYCCEEPDATQILLVSVVAPCNPYSYCLPVCEYSNPPDPTPVGPPGPDPNPPASISGPNWPNVPLGDGEQTFQPFFESDLGVSRPLGYGPGGDPGTGITTELLDIWKDAVQANWIAYKATNGITTTGEQFYWQYSPGDQQLRYNPGLYFGPPPSQYQTAAWKTELWIGYLT